MLGAPELGTALVIPKKTKALRDTVLLSAWDALPHPSLRAALLFGAFFGQPF